MRKLGIIISFRMAKEEPKQSEFAPPSTYNYEIQQGSANAIPHVNFLSRNAMMTPLCKTASRSYSLCQNEILNGNREEAS